MPSQETQAAQTQPSPRRGTPAPPHLTTTAARTGCRPAASSPHGPGRAGPSRAGPSRPVPTGSYHTLKPRRKQHHRTEPPRPQSPPVSAPAYWGPSSGPTLLPRPSLHRARPKEGGSPPAGSGAEPGGAAAPGPARPPRDPRAPGSGTSSSSSCSCSTRPSSAGPRSASAAPQRRQQLTGSSLRRAPRVKPAPRASRDARELPGTAEGQGGLYRNAPLARTVRGSDLKGIGAGSEAGLGCFQKPNADPRPWSAGEAALRTTTPNMQRAPAGRASPSAPYGVSVARPRVAWWEL